MAKKRVLALITAILMIVSTLPAMALETLVLPTGVQAMGATGVNPSDYDKLAALLTDYFEYKDPDDAGDGKDAGDGAAAFYADLASSTSIDLSASGIGAADFTILYDTLAGADTSGGQADIIDDLIALASTSWAGPRDNLMAADCFVDSSVYGPLTGSKAGAYYLYIMEALQGQKLATYDNYTEALTVDFGTLSKDTAIDKYAWDSKASFDPGDTFSDFAAYLFTGTTPAQTDSLISYMETELADYAAAGDTEKGFLKRALSGTGMLRNTSSAPSSGGGGAPAEETPEESVVKEPVVREDEEGRIVVTTEVEHAAEVVVSDDGTELAHIDKDVMESAIESVLTAVASSQEEAAAAIQLDIDADTMDLSAQINLCSADCICENHVETIVKTGKLIFEMPSEILDAAAQVAHEADENWEDHEDELDISVSSHQVSKEDVIGKIDTSTPEGEALAKAAEDKTKFVEISMGVLSNGTSIGEVHDLHATMTIDISLEDMPDTDSDKLGVYYLDEITGQPVFMGGHVVIKDGVRMIEFTADHLSKFAIMEFEVTYLDIATHWSKQYVESMGSKHIISGYPDGNFLPEKAVTRAEFAKLVAEAMGYGSLSYKGTFTDVVSTDWHSGYVAATVSNGIIEGYEDGTFKPDESITRLEMAAMLAKASKNKLVESEDKVLAYFADDLSIAEWGRISAAKAVEAGLINGMDGELKPQATATRAQAATAIYRLFNR